MRQFSAPELVELLRQADRSLAEAAEVVLVGGAAFGLVHDSPHATKDIDFVNASVAARTALERAAGELGIPVQDVSGIYEAPRDWEDRREILAIPELTKLAVFVPERYDLAIMKLARGATHDLDAVEGLHAKAPLELRVLVERYRTTDVLGDGLDFKFALVGLVERLWGEDEADRLLTQLDNA